MSGALHSWYSLPDLIALAERGAVIEGQIELKKLGRLGSLLHSSQGSAKVQLHFRKRHDDLVALELRLQASLELVCQRCLEPLVHELSEQVEFVLAQDENALTVLPQGLELIALNGDRWQPAALIEDELIVSLPLVPRHGDDQNQEN